MTQDRSAEVDELGPGAPTPPIPIEGGGAAATSKRRGSRVGITEAVLRDLRSTCAEVSEDPEVIGEASRDWWPLAMTWALAGQVGSRAAAVARPTTAQEVAELLAVCNKWGLPNGNCQIAMNCFRKSPAHPLASSTN